MKKKKLIAVLLSAAMVGGMLAGCGGSGDSDKADSSDKKEATGKVYYLNFKPEQADQWVALAEKYTEETGVQVDVQTAASGTYESQLKSEMAKDEAPTLFQVNGPVGLATWKDYCYDLADSQIYKDVQRIGSTDAIEGTYLENYKNIWDLYITDSTCDASMISSKTGEDAASEFALGEAVFYQNGTWAYNDIKDNEVADEDLGMLPIYIGAEGEEDQGLCTGSENYWCVNKNASEEDIQATLDFMTWVVESDEGREALANEMGFVTPFTTFADYLPSNPLVQANEEYTEAGKTPVTWNFTTMPSEEWKNGVGSALLEYAQGTGDWSTVETAFVDGWATEYAAANE